MATIPPRWELPALPSHAHPCLIRTHWFAQLFELCENKRHGDLSCPTVSVDPRSNGLPCLTAIKIQGQVRRCPDPMPGEESEIEIRPLFDGGGLRQGVHAGASRSGGTGERRGLSAAALVRRNHHGFERQIEDLPAP